MRDGAPLTARVGATARRPLVSCPREATIGDAARHMVDSDTASVVFLDGAGRPAGILTDSDLRRRVVAARLDPGVGVDAVMTKPEITIRRDELGLQAIETMLARRIERAASVEELAEARRSYVDSVRVLVEAGASPLGIGRIIAEANDRLQRRLVDLAQAELGRLSGAFCWLVMGSEGRRIQTLARLRPELERRGALTLRDALHWGDVTRAP